MTPNLGFLNVARVNGIMMGLQDPRTIPQDLTWLKRTNVVPAMDEEITARYFGQVLAADLIADDQRAGVYQEGRFQFETNKIPNLKIGVGINQSMLNVISRMQQGYASPNDQGIFSNWENRTQGKLLLGIRQRMEHLIVSMLCDGLNYNRLGIVLNGVTWGMFSDLKVTVSVSWDQAGSATPVNDVLNIKMIASIRYNIIYDRITMSTQAFRYMIATTEFQNKARLYLAPNVSYVNLPLADLKFQQAVATNVFGMTVEIYDSRFWQQDEYGNAFQSPYLPITQVLLTSSALDGNAMAWDFANAIVTETMVAQLAGSSIVGGAFAGPKYGPVSYVTPTSFDLNSPGITYWGVARGFPRKHMQNSSACLTVGTFADTIAIGVPIPQ
jgi:hypothetical protein